MSLVSWWSDNNFWLEKRKAATRQPGNIGSSSHMTDEVYVCVEYKGEGLGKRKA